MRIFRDWCFKFESNLSLSLSLSLSLFLCRFSREDDNPSRSSFDVQNAITANVPLDDRREKRIVDHEREKAT